MTTPIQISWVASNDMGSLLAACDASQFTSVFRGLDKLNANTHFVCAIENGKVVGAVKVYIGPNADNLHIEMFEVAANARGRHISRPIMNAVVDYAAQHNRVISGDGATQDGNTYLSRLFKEASERAGVECGPAVMGRV